LDRREAQVFTTRPELLGCAGMVASTHWLASATGMAVLEAGGNAFDAAVASGFVLQVVEPHLNGPGGEVPILAYAAESGEVVVINGQGPAPRAASVGRFRDLGLDLVPGTGLLAACVPGAFDAWLLLLREYGTLSLRAVLRYAIGYARHGFPVVPAMSVTIAEAAGLFREEWTDSADIYLSASGPPAPGTVSRNPALAETYTRIVSQAEAAGRTREAQIDAARDAFYRGFVAEAIAAYLTKAEVMDSSGERHAGLLDAEDLALYAARREAPVSLDYHGYTVFKAPPWCQGPVFLQQLALLADFDLSAMEPRGADFIHTVTECAKLAFADREAYYGDPDFVAVPLEDLLDPGYASARRRLTSPEASHELLPGHVAGHKPRLPPVPLSQPERDRKGAGAPTIAPAGDTCHVDVVDRFGNLVAATPSGGWLQSSPVIPSLGFCLGTRAQMFWLTEGLPNSLEGGKRPRTTLTPSLAFREGDPYLAFGTPGGDQQDQWTLNFFLYHVHFGMNLQEAIDAPNFHTDHFPSSFYPRTARPGGLVVEGRLEDSVTAELRRRGHEVVVEGPWSLGRISAAGREPSGMLKAAANARGMQGYAVGR
jgi:gamma-glutamyltranspeptidase/glutathione hydrolase